MPQKKTARHTYLNSDKIWHLLCYAAIVVLLLVGALHLLKADLFYDTDIARDMLLLEDMVQQHKPSLIGGRTSISGVFHGPVYYWLMLPFFVVSQGNPVMLSWVWFVMYLGFIAGFYYVGRKVFDETVAATSTALLTSATINYADGFTHSVLANFLIVPLIYLVYRYVTTDKIGWLIAAVLTAGLLIQFQMAFGVPVLILAGGYALLHILRQRNYIHVLAGVLLLVPLSTFVLFDIRHEFIQFNSALATLTGKNGGAYSLNGYWPDRWSSFIDSFRFWSTPIIEIQHFYQISVVLVLAWLTFHNVVAGKKAHQFITLATLIIFGFWIVITPFKGNIWSHYYRALLPIIVLCCTYAVVKYWPRKFYIPIAAIIIGSNTFFALRYGLTYFNSTATADEVHWQFYQKLARDVVENSEGKQYGYYVFSPDQFGYQAKYALRYVAQAHDAAFFPYTKQTVTYLIEAPYWDDNKFLSKEYWKNGQVRITRESDQTWQYHNAAGGETYRVLRFDLSAEETTVSAEPTLLDGIHFR